MEGIQQMLDVSENCLGTGKRQRGVPWGYEGLAHRITLGPSSPFVVSVSSPGANSACDRKSFQKTTCDSVLKSVIFRL